MKQLVVVAPEILGGTPVLAGTRVPIRTLFEYLEDNLNLETFLAHFPTVSEKQAVGVLEESEIALVSRRIA